MLAKYLDKFEKSLSITHHSKVVQVYKDIFNFKPIEELPFVFINLPVDSNIDTDWPQFDYNDTFHDPEKMLLDQLREPFLHHQLRDYHAINIRTNYGTPIMASLFGAGVQLTDTSLPWANQLESIDDIKKVIDRGIPDFRNGLGSKCIDTATYFKETLAKYPKLNQAIKISQPDMQGPFGIAHQLWGHDIFYAMFDHTEMVHSLLKLITETFIQWFKYWQNLFSEKDQLMSYLNVYIKGTVMLRSDEAVMVSPGDYEQFINKYERILLKEFGGCNHFCGKGDAFIKTMCRSKNLFGLNISQPELNDMNLFFESMLSNKLVILGISQKYLPVKIKTGAIIFK